MVSGYESLVQLCNELKNQADQQELVTVELLNDALQRVVRAISEMEK